jgi:glucose/arabinose dehydrogenase
MRRALGILATILVLGGACTSGGGVVVETPVRTSGSTSSAPATGTGSSGSAPDLSRVSLRAVQVADLAGPLGMAVRKDDEALYFAEQVGVVVAVRNGRLDPTPVLDIRAGVAAGGERGLLGLAFSADGRFLYVDYTDLHGDTHVTEFGMGENGRADPASRREVLFVRQPFGNHNGGEVIFGPDGYLYVGLGDGGSEGDPQDNSQSLSTLLGKVLRIDPRKAAGSAYAIPSGNPFVGRAGARPEIWAYGLRNPWRFSFDRQTGDLWIGDVGGSQREEVDYQPAASNGGENYGWNRMEGSVPFQGGRPANAVPPIFDYSHEGGNCVVTGGYVYRGSEIPDLVGSYLFADFCVGRLTALRQEGGRVVQRRAFRVRIPEISSFGEDRNGELYAISLAGAVYRIEAA